MKFKNFNGLDKIPQGYLRESEQLSDAYVRKVKSLYTLPEVYLDIKTVLDNQDSTVNDISDVIKYDIALSAKIIGLVNSAYYQFSKEITSIKHAVSILGRKKVSQLVLTATVSDAFKDIPKQLIDMRSFWKWSVMTALIAKENAQKINYPNPDDIFTIALLHNIGKLVMLCQSPKSMKKVYALANPADSLNFLAAEFDVFGFSHSQTGASLMKVWKLPEVFQEVARYHHFPVFHTAHYKEIAMVYLAVQITDYFKKHHEYQPEILESEAMINCYSILKTGIDQELLKDITLNSYQQMPSIVPHIYQVPP